LTKAKKGWYYFYSTSFRAFSSIWSWYALFKVDKKALMEMMIVMRMIHTQSGLLFIMTFLLGPKDELLEKNWWQFLIGSCWKLTLHFLSYFFSNHFLIKNSCWIVFTMMKNDEESYLEHRIDFHEKLFFFFCVCDFWRVL
jgi:hypothetical protein